LTTTRTPATSAPSTRATIPWAPAWWARPPADEAAALKNSQIAEELALPPVKIHCSILAEDAIKAAVDDYKKKHLATA
jgi:hypothetical protein